MSVPVVWTNVPKKVGSWPVSSLERTRLDCSATPFEQSGKLTC